MRETAGSALQTVRDVGEFGLIALLADALPPETRGGPGVQLGIGDDAAVWTPTPGRSVVITTDSLVEGVHFRTDWTDWESLGYKALGVNVSDLAAMGAIPKIAVVTLGLRGSERVQDLQELYAGLGSLARRHEMIVAGGDIVRSPHCLTIHVTALGESRGDHVLTRAGAAPGDMVAVSGTLGASAAGMRLLQLDQEDPRRRARTADHLIEAHLRPEPRVGLGGVLLAGGATSAMDLSDGLLGDLPKIAEASGVSVELDARRVPVAASVRALFPEEWLEFALRGGEDYELLFTAPRDAWDRLEKAVAEAGGSVTAIGSIFPVGEHGPAIHLVDLNGARREISPGAFDHFLAH